MAVYRVPAEAVSQALALDANALSNLKAQARASPEQALSKAAGQFEALFLQMVLKQMRETLPKDGPFDSDTMRNYTSMFDHQIAQHLSSRGVGLREALEKQLARSMGLAPAKSVSPAVDLSTAPLRKSEAPQAIPQPSAPSKTSGSERGGVATTVQAFIERLRPHAEAAAKTLGIPAHLLLAQAGLETGWGRSQPRSADGSVSHNLFGIKSTKRWGGASVAAATTEFVQGAAVRTVERFRAYGSYADSFLDAAKLLRSDRYAEALAHAQDAGAYARSLQRAGYATDPQYAEKLTRAIRMVSQHLAARPSATTLAEASAQVTARRADNPLNHAAG